MSTKLFRQRVSLRPFRDRGGFTAYQFGAAALAILMAVLWLKDERLKQTLQAEDEAQD